MTLPELIEKLMAATEGSRELDFWIATVTEWRSPPEHHFDGGAAHMRFAKKQFEQRTGLGPEVCDDMRLPRYTTSLDAALTLVPAAFADNWDLRIRNGDSCHAEVYMPSYQQDGLARTPALAFCIAALRARSFEHGRTAGAV